MEHVVGKKIKKNIKVVMGDPNLVEEGELFLGYNDNDQLVFSTRMAGQPNLVTVAQIANNGVDYFMGNLGEVLIDQIFNGELKPIVG